MEIKKSTDLIGSTRTTSISIGNSRTGKTHFIGTIANVGKLIVLDAEDGLKTIKDCPFDFVTANNWEDVKAFLNWFLEQGGHSGYTHLAIDSINRIQSYLVNAIKDNSQPFTKKTDDNKGTMTLNKWGIVAAQLRKVTELLTKLAPTSVHFNVTAMESKDEVTGSTMLYPALSGSFKHEILGYFDTICYHRAAVDGGQQKYWIQLGADNRIQAGTRIQELKNEYGTVMPVDYACIHNALLK